MTSVPGVRDLLRIALDEFDRPATTVSASARRALRIAALRRDYVNQLWLQCELTDIQAGGKVDKSPSYDPNVVKIRRQLDVLLGPDEGRQEAVRGFMQYERNRTLLDNGEEMLLAPSLGQIEQALGMTQRVYDDLTVPASLTPVDTYLVSRDMDAARAKVLPSLQRDAQVLERVKTAIHSFLVATEAELDEGQHESPLFQRAQDYINSALGKYAPEALEKFVAAQDRLYSGNPEELAHALTSCRRMIKALADALYPATGQKITGEDGVERTMSDDLYRNRLVQYVREQLGNRVHGSVVQTTLDSLGARLRSLDSLASKGVHDTVSSAEAETCIVWTYLLAADIVRIADGSSPLLDPDDSAPSVAG